MYKSLNKSVRPIETKDFCSIKYFYLIIRWVCEKKYKAIIIGHKHLSTESNVTFITG